MDKAGGEILPPAKEKSRKLAGFHQAPCGEAKTVFTNPKNSQLQAHPYETGERQRLGKDNSRNSKN